MFDFVIANKECNDNLFKRILISSHDIAYNFFHKKYKKIQFFNHITSMLSVTILSFIASLIPPSYRICVIYCNFKMSAIIPRIPLTTTTITTFEVCNAYIIAQ